MRSTNIIQKISRIGNFWISIDMATLKRTDGGIEYLFGLLKEKLLLCSSELIREISTLDCIEDVTELLGRAIREDTSVSVREGNIIKPTYNSELNELQSIKLNSKQ